MQANEAIWWIAMAALSGWEITSQATHLILKLITLIMSAEHFLCYSTT